MKVGDSFKITDDIFKRCPCCGDEQLSLYGLGFNCGFHWIKLNVSKVTVYCMCKKYNKPKPFKFISIEAVRSLENFDSWIRSQ